MLKYLTGECKKFKCCVCANDNHCLGRSGNHFELVSKSALNERLLSSPHRYSSIEKILMRDVLNGMEMDEIETKEKEYMKEDITRTEQIARARYIEGKIGSAREEGYKAGLEEAWEIATKVGLESLDGGYTRKELRSIFGNDSWINIFKNLSIHEVKEKIAAYEAEQAKPKLGDVVKCESLISNAMFVGFLINENEKSYNILLNDNIGLHDQELYKDCWTIEKTGKHFDIQSMLDEIG